MKSVEEIFDKYKAIQKKKAEEYSVTEKVIADFVLHIRNFYKIYDLHEKTNHSQIFELLFIDKRNLSSESISQRTYISVKTLYRFKIQYLDFILEAMKNDVFGDGIGQILTEFFD